MRDTIDMAREAGLNPDALAVQFLKAFEALVRADEREETNRRANASWSLMCEKMVAAEREACAKVCESFQQDPYEELLYKSDFAAAIRARGNT